MYAIKPLTEVKKPKSEIPEFLPQPPFRLLVLSPSGGGKSLCLGNMLSRDEFGYKKTFKKNVFMFSPTFGMNDPSWHGVDIDERHVFNDYDEIAIREICAEQEKLIKQKGRAKAPHVLFIFDDMLTALPIARQSSLVSLAFHGRHLRISFIITCQAHRACPLPIRLNATHLLVFRCCEIQVKSLAEEQPIDTNTFHELYKTATDDPFSFLYVNQCVPIPDRYYLRFDAKLKFDNEDPEENS